MTTFGHQDYQILKREVLYEGFFRLVKLTIRQKLFKGGWSESYTRELHERSSAAAVLPYDPHLNRVILIEQFRPGSLSDPETPWIIEIPAGVLKPDDDPIEVARHEAMEESGCQLLNIHHLYSYFVSPGGSVEYLDLYCGQVDSSCAGGIFGLKDENEDIRVHNLEFEEALAWLEAGKIKTSPAICSLLWLRINKEKLIEKWSK